MYVLFDYVMNHVDDQSGLYAAHGDWFYLEGGSPVLCSPSYWNDSYYSTRCAFTTYLPAFDFYNPTVRQWSVADATWWASEYGIDGYRLDAIGRPDQTERARTWASTMDGHASNRLRTAHHAVGDDLLFFRHLAVASPHKPFDGEKRVLRVGHGLPFGGIPDEPFPVVLKRYDGRGQTGSLRIGDHHGLCPLHNRHHRVGRAQVDSDDLGSHNSPLPVSVFIQWINGSSSRLVSTDPFLPLRPETGPSGVDIPGHETLSPVKRRV
jgi:hypothetical protein